MCGILGVIPYETESCLVPKKKQLEIASYLHNELLLRTQKRGKDATGIVYTFTPRMDSPPDIAGNPPYFYLLKQPVPAEEFLQNDGSSSYKYKDQDPIANIKVASFQASNLKNRELLHIIGHTRYGTTGSEYCSDNNHPIKIGNIIGVHNGGISNHKKLYEMHPNMNKVGEVDSEVIMQLLAQEANDRELAIEDGMFLSKRLKGAYAIIAFNARYPNKVLVARNSERPVVFAYLPELGLLVITSEKVLLDNVLETSYKRLSYSLDVPEVTPSWSTMPANKATLLDAYCIANKDAAVTDLVSYADIDKLPDLKYFDIQKQKAIVHHTGFNNTTQKQTAKQKQQSPKIKDSGNYPDKVSITDYSVYDNQITKAATPSASASDEVVLDNVEITSVVEVAEEEETNLLDDFSTLRQEGGERLLQIAKEEETLYKQLLPTTLQNPLKLAPKGFRNVKVADEIASNTYVIAFSEGYAVGTMDTVEDQDAFVPTTQEGTDLQIKTLKAQLKTAKEKAASYEKSFLLSKKRTKKASVIIANLKRAFIAAVVRSGDATIRKGSVRSHFLLTSDFVEMTEKNSYLSDIDIDLIENIFKSSDVALVRALIAAYVTDDDAGAYGGDQDEAAEVATNTVVEKKGAI